MLDTGRVVHTGPAAELLADRDARPLAAWGRGVSTVVLLTITGLGLAAMYFLVASGLSLIYGLMGVLNFAHGALITVGAYGMWYTESKLGGIPVAPRFLLASLVGIAVGTLFAVFVELVMIRPLYGRHIEQVLVTVGLALCTTALVTAIWGNDPKFVALPPWTSKTTTVLGALDPERPLDRDPRRARRALRARPVPAQDALRADRSRRRREPLDGDRARDRRPQGVHARLRDRRARRRARGRALRHVLRHGRPAARHEPPHLRLHRRRDRRARVDLGDGRRRRPRRARPAVRQLLRLRRHRRPLRSCCCSRSCSSPGRAGSSRRRPHETLPRRGLRHGAVPGGTARRPDPHPEDRRPHPGAVPERPEQPRARCSCSR